MTRLLLRIFVAMVLTNSLAGLGMAVVYGGGFERHRAHDMYLVDTTLAHEGAAALALLEANDLPGAERALAALGDEIGLAVALADPKGGLRAGALDAAPANIAALVANAAPSAPAHSDAMHAVAIDGAVVVGQRLRPDDVVPLSPPTMQLVLVVLFSAVISLALSRWLAGPLETLRAGTERLAAGSGEVRVMPAMPRFADAEVLALAKDFDRMAARIEGLLESHERLLRDVSHELRSPLARLAVALELARERAGEGARGPLDRIEKEAERLGQLIGSVLAMAKLEQAPSAQDEAEVQLDLLVSEIGEDAAFEAKASGRFVQVSVLDGTRVLGNEELLRQAFENVVRNALRWTPEGSQVQLDLRVDGSAARFSVRDHGPGVPEAALEEIFLPFARVQAARDRASGGAGLGLAITARAVRLHGGEVRARNHPEGGLEVIVELPSLPRHAG